MILKSVRQHNHFITQGNYKATCFDYRLVILRPILSIVPQDAMHTLGSHRVDETEELIEKCRVLVQK